MFRAGVEAGGELDVLRDVDENRARTARPRDVERLVHDAREFFHRLDEVVVLGRGAGNADRVAFLERIRADEMGRDLAGDDDERDRIHQRVDHAGDGVGGAGAGGDEDDADLAGGAGIAFSRMGRALLVPDQDVLQLVLLEQRVVDRQHGAARIAENRVHALIEQRADNHLCAGHALARF